MEEDRYAGMKLKERLLAQAIDELEALERHRKFLEDKAIEAQQKVVDAGIEITEARAVIARLKDERVPAPKKRKRRKAISHEQARDWFRSKVGVVFTADAMVEELDISDTQARTLLTWGFEQSMLERVEPGANWPGPAVGWSYVKPQPQPRLAEPSDGPEVATAAPVSGTGKSSRARSGNTYLDKELRRVGAKVDVTRTEGDHLRVTSRATGQSFVISNTPGVDVTQVVRSKLRGIGVPVD